MENSVDFIHPKSLIQTSSDKKLFVKSNSGWEEQDNIMYKSEYHLPSDEGNNGDFFAKYYRRYNYIKYSENFTLYPWAKRKCSVRDNQLYKFPYNNCKELYDFEEYGEHALVYEFYNNFNTIYTFSIYAKLRNLRKIQLALMDYHEEYGVKARFDLSTGTGSLIPYGSQVGITDTNYSIELADETMNVYRISITASIGNAIALKAKINVLDNSFNEEFSIDSGNTICINGAQLSKSANVEPYLYSNGKYASALSFEKLYKKENNTWIETNNNVYYLTEKPSEIGIIGDIAVMDSILCLYPFVRFGNTENVSRLDRPLGFMYYDNKEGSWYIKTRKSIRKVKVGKVGNDWIERTFYSDCKLMLGSQSADRKAIAMAITLNQQTYNTYNRYGLKLMRPGFNTGGNTNFWMRNYSRTRY